MSRFLDPKVDAVDSGAAEEIFSANLIANRTILAVGESARVQGISIANSSGKPAEVTFIDGASKLKFRETVSSKNTIHLNIPFDTAGGLIAESLPGAQASDVFISVFYFPEPVV